jgi:hypothetical protein
MAEESKHRQDPADPKRMEMQTDTSKQPEEAEGMIREERTISETTRETEKR